MIYRLMRSSRMRRGYCSPTVGLLLFMLITASLSARETPQVRDPSDTWRYGIAEFRVVADSPALESLQWRIPQLLKSTLRACPVHHYREEERRARALRLRERKIEELEAEITEARGNLDEQFFEETSRRSRKDLQNELRELLRRREELRDLEAQDVKVPEHKACVYTQGGGVEGLLSRPRVPAWLPMREKQLDFLITGSVEETSELLFLEIYGYRADSRSEELLWSGNFRAAELEEAVERASRDIRSALYGRPWADLSVRTDPPKAQVRLITKGSRRENAGGFFRYLSPGEARIEVRAEGYGTEVRTVQLLPQEHKRIRVELSPRNTAELRIHSLPQKAEVYVDARRVGTAPLSVEEAVLPAYLTLRREGYQEKNVLIEKDPEERVLRYRLHPEEVNTERVVGNARERFYFGLAGFFLSVPLTMYSYGKSIDYAFTYATASGVSSAERQRLHDLSQLWYTAYLGSLFLNGTFLADTIIQMWNYTNTAQAR